MAKKRRLLRFTLSPQQILYIALILVIFLFLIFRMMPDKTAFINAERYAETVTSTAYVFKDEQYVYLDKTTDINFTCEEGDKVSAATVLSDNYQIQTSVYIDERIKVLDYMIENPQINTKQQVYTLMYHVKTQMRQVDYEMQQAINNNDTEKKRELLSKRQELQEQYEILKGAVQYVFTPLSERRELRSQYMQRRAGGSMPLTLENLNFNIFGTISYSTDGYENVLGFDNLTQISLAYLNGIDQSKPLSNDSLNKYVIKSSTTDRAVVAMRIPLDTYIESELRVLEKYKSLYANYDIDLNEGDCYQFLYRRIDILNTFPSIGIRLKDNTALQGQLINVIRGEKEKIVVIAFRNDVAKLNGLRIFNASLETALFNCYKIPESALYQKDGRTYVNIMLYGSEKSSMEVVVYKKEGRYAILKTSENTALKDGAEIFIYGD